MDEMHEQGTNTCVDRVDYEYEAVLDETDEMGSYKTMEGKVKLETRRSL